MGLSHSNGKVEVVSESFVVSFKPYHSGTDDFLSKGSASNKIVYEYVSTDGKERTIILTTPNVKQLYLCESATEKLTLFNSFVLALKNNNPLSETAKVVLPSTAPTIANLLDTEK